MGGELDDAVRAVVERARRAQRVWAVVPIEERCERLLRLRDVVVDRADELVEIIAREHGKTRAEALADEVTRIVDLVTYVSKHAPAILAPRPTDRRLLRRYESYVDYVPRGVIGIIGPRSYPFAIPMGDVVAALVTGSAAVVKPSEAAPRTMTKAKELFDSSGLPEDLLGVVHGDGSAGAALIDAAVDKIVFTGSADTGRCVAAACGSRLVPCVLELAPFGSAKRGGYGRGHGDDALRDMADARHVDAGRFALPANPIGFPYAPSRPHWIERTLRSMFARR